MPRPTALIALLLPALLSGCVGKKKFLETEYLHEEAMKRERQLQAQLDFAGEQLEQWQRRNEELSNTIGVLRDVRAVLENDTTRQGERIRELRRQARSTREELSAELATRSERLAEREQRLTEIREAIRRRDQRLQEALVDLRDTLRALSSDDVQLEMRSGRLYLSFSDYLLFGGRSTTLSRDGKGALGVAASVLNRYPDLEVIVMGHTNTDRPRRGYADNWDLSVRRAAAVVRTLTEEHDVSSNQLTAAGKGEFQPLAPNDNTPNKLLNRRLELILTPRLDMLYNVLREN